MNAQDTATAFALAKARDSQLILIRTTPRRYAIARLGGMGAYGIPGEPGQMVGINNASILKAYSNLNWHEAITTMVLFDKGNLDPWDCETV